MNGVTFGNNIAALRKKNGMTQAALAELLGVSDKSISKWERGSGCPDITVLPKLAGIFGVSLDRLILGEEKGIAIAGNIVIDIVKDIESYPEQGMLADVANITKSVGGCPPNTGIDIVKMDKRIPVSAIGKVGNDENGKYIVSELQKHGINTDKISYTSDAPTSFTDVMSVPSGERTFFHKRGANAEFSPEDIDIDDLNCSIFHIGYILLLDKFDAPDKQYGTVMARFLHNVQKRGIKTSIDVVSDSKGEFKQKVLPALKYCNYVIINEIECTGIWNINPRLANGDINRAGVRLAMEKTMAEGVRDVVIVHSKETSFILDSKGEFTEVPSLNVPKEDIKGTVGAGDAFCAGCLLGLYNGSGNKEILEFASAAAACSLLEANSVDGMKERNEIMRLVEKYGRRA